MQNGDADGDSSDGSLAGEMQLEPEEAASPAEPIVTPVPREVYVVDSLPKAQIALQRLQAIHAADPETIFACDTEVRLLHPLAHYWTATSCRWSMAAAMKRTHHSES